MPVILRLLAAGVPAAKIIAKYGKTAYKAAKKLYNKAKADIKEADKIDIKKGEWIKSSNLLKAGLGLGVITTGILKYTKSKSKKKEKENLRSFKDKKFKGHSSYKE